MLSHLKKYDIILGSGSPRRQELLKGLDIDFRIELKETDETYPNDLVGVDIPTYVAQLKADAYTLNDNTLLITADTIVWLEGKVYGKPKDREDAKRILSKLSGKSHQVITGMCLKTKERKRVFHVITEVYFSRFTEEEIDYYLDNYKPYDKAGAYGVQEWIGFIGVERIEGSYYNVMGLPIQRLYSELKNWK
ncbi:MAG TPA: septum formation protein Maf [Bacteroidales bacterium]|nr:septum formation protein Maf [Bacteroidales bacterium]